MKYKLKPVHFENSRADSWHHAFSFFALGCSAPLVLSLIAIPAILASLLFALEEYDSFEPPRQFSVFLSPIIFAAAIAIYGIVFYVPEPPYFTTTHSEFEKQIPLILFGIASVWLISVPLLLAHKKWRGVLLAFLWIPTLYVVTILASMSVSGVWL